MTKANAGFTLLEMLIAIAIFAMIGLASNAVLSTVLTNDEVTKGFATRLKFLQQGFGVIERDLTQMIARTSRLPEGGRRTQVFQTGNDIQESESGALIFYRLGWLNPDGLLARGSIQLVAYMVQQGRLERWYYPYPDPEVGAEPIKTVLIDKVLAVEYAFFTDQQWTQRVDSTILPEAIAMTVDIEGVGKIQRKFLLPQGAPAVSNATDDTVENADKDDLGSDDANEQGAAHGLGGLR